MGCVCTDHSGGSSSLLSVCFVGKTLARERYTLKKVSCMARFVFSVV